MPLLSLPAFPLTFFVRNQAAFTVQLDSAFLCVIWSLKRVCSSDFEVSTSSPWFYLSPLARMECFAKRIFNQYVFTHPDTVQVRGTFFICH